MLAKISERPNTPFSSGRFAIVAAKYNATYVDALVAAAEREFQDAGGIQARIIRVPGSFEIPVVVAALCQQAPAYAAIVCFGAILRGGTTHADHIAVGVTQALASLQITFRVPIIHGVLQFENEEQARIRCCGAESNRGTEAARTALSMAEIMQNLAVKS